jgi:aspartate racemase
MKKIGIVGGLGPEPTIDYYRIIVDLYREKEKTEDTPEILLYSLNLRAFLSMMEADRKTEAVDYLANALKCLASAGADFALIAAGTPHIFLDEIRECVSIPILSIVEETMKGVQKFGMKNVGLFGTKFTMQADFYQKVFTQENISLVIPKSNEQDYIHSKLINELQFGRVVEDTRNRMMNIVKRMLDEDSIQGLILGCTELPLILPDEGLGIPFFNTTRIHAEAAVEQCLSPDT